MCIHSNTLEYTLLQRFGASEIDEDYEMGPLSHFRTRVGGLCCLEAIHLRDCFGDNDKTTPIQWQ